jgi:predicted ATP-dependent serine protease
MNKQINEQEKKKIERYEKYKKILFQRNYLYDPNVQEDKKFLTIQDKTIGTAGNFIVFTGLPKIGKSSLISAMIASAINKKPVLDMQLQLYKDKNKIGWFDTEQSKFDFNSKLRQINTYTNNSPMICLDCFLMKKDSSEDIIGTIEAYLQTEKKAAVIIIDGLLSCVENFNDESEAKRMVKTLSNMAEDYGVLIVTVLHVGKKDFHSIGHLGSATDRYCQSTLYFEMEKDGSRTISGKLLRSAPNFEPINCVFDNNKKVLIKNNQF